MIHRFRKWETAIDSIHKGNLLRGSIRNGKFSRGRVLKYWLLQNCNPERNVLFKQQNNLQSGLKSVREKAGFGRWAKNLHFCNACSGASDKHECIPSVLCPARELSKWLQGSLNVNNLNLQMNSRHMGTRLRRFFFPLRPLWKLAKEQTSAYYGSFTSGDSGISLYSLQDRICFFPIIVFFKPQLFRISKGLN